MTPEQIAELKAIVRSLQKDAVIVEGPKRRGSMERLDTDRFDFMRAYNSAAWIEAMEHPEERRPRGAREYDIETFVYSRRKPFDLQKFTDFVEKEGPTRSSRVKGPLWQASNPDMCYMFEQAGHQMRLMEERSVCRLGARGREAENHRREPRDHADLGRRDGRPHDEPVHHRPSHGQGCAHRLPRCLPD